MLSLYDRPEPRDRKGDDSGVGRSAEASDPDDWFDDDDGATRVIGLAIRHWLIRMAGTAAVGGADLVRFPPPEARSAKAGTRRRSLRLIGRGVSGSARPAAR